MTWTCLGRGADGADRRRPPGRGRAAEQGLRIEQLQARAVEETGWSRRADRRVRPAPAGPVPARGGRTEAPRDVRAARATRSRRSGCARPSGSSLLGKVNPLALEEFAALEERHQFLADAAGGPQDAAGDLLRWSRRSTSGSQEVFATAYADTAREFESVFARLFPGGEGRLVLTEPDDMLTTGIEVEARPPGKKVKRLSLLSGGERSLIAVALLVAIFRARPSPFYMMDEVEAALDDTNLGRLLEHLRRAAREQPAHRHHPPEAHDGGGRRAVRRDDAR